ncbi:MAG: hypothetical protein AB7T74_07075 [Clostridia bacterium]|jgi:hypothetical protein
MDRAFWIRLAVSFIIAGTWISVASLLAERLGSLFGGLIANMPSNIVVSMIFMSLVKGEGFAAEAARAVPLGMAIDTLFLFVFMATAGLGILKAIPISLAAWAGCAWLAFTLPPIPFWGGIVLFVVLALGCFLVAEVIMGIRSVPKQSRPFNPLAFGLRAVFAGTVVAGAVAASTFAPPYLTGILATFPAVLLSTMSILTLSQGPAFSRGAGKILLVSSSNIIIYAFCVQASFPVLGVLWGTLLSFGAALVWIALLRPVMTRVH